MQVLYKHDMRNVAVFAVLTGRRIRLIASTSRNAPEDWEVEALLAKRKRPVEGFTFWWRYLGVPPEHVVTCRLREPVGGDPKGKYPLEALRVVLTGPESVTVMPYPTSDVAWRELLMWAYTTMLDAAIYREGRNEALRRAHRAWKKRVAQQKKMRESVRIFGKCERASGPKGDKKRVVKASREVVKITSTAKKKRGRRAEA